jgi:CRP/FNR family transcriptional regulator
MNQIEQPSPFSLSPPRAPPTGSPAPPSPEVSAVSAPDAGLRHVIYSATETPRCLYLVERGRVRLVRSHGNGRPTLVALLGPGDVFGRARRDAVVPTGEAAIAMEGTEVRAIEPEELERLCQGTSKFALDAIARLTASLLQERLRVEGFTSSAVPARLAQTLLRLGEVHGEPCRHGGAIDLRRITQEDLADLSGACRPFVSTLINQMKRKGWVGSKGRVLCLLDLQALRQAAFDA